MTPSLRSVGDDRGTVVYLNGIAASGKSTLASNLQAAWPEPFLHVGLDMLTATMPRRFLGDGPDADLGARWVTGPDGRLATVESGPFGTRLLRGIPRLAAALARAGSHVIVDDVLLYGWRVADVARAMDGVHAHFVEVRCAREVAKERGRDRPGRESSSAMIDVFFDDTYANDVYDLRLDTGRDPPQTCAERLLTYLRDEPTPRAFARLREAASTGRGAERETSRDSPSGRGRTGRHPGRVG